MSKVIKIFLVIVIFLGGILFYFNHKMQGAKSNSPVEKKFIITSGEGVNQISHNLETSGLISDNIFFDVYIWKSGREDKIVTGTYLLRPNMTIPEIVDLITSGKAEPQDLKITLIEGWTGEQIAEYLSERNIVAKEDFASEINNITKYQSQYQFLAGLNPQKDTLEGFLFPDTYLVYPDTTAEMIIIKMLNNFEKKVTDTMRSDIEKNDRSLKDSIIMASIIEKEVGDKKDQKIVSGIFWERLAINHPLQSCATINYVLGSNKKQLSLEDTRIDSPYNTYTHKGLPPGPIANPGINAISASIYPQESDYFYFLSDPQSGEIIFSRTLEEHNRNKEKFGL